MNNLAFLWLGIALSFLIVEMSSPGFFFFLSFFFGSCACSLLSFWTTSFLFHGLLFLLVTCFSFFILRVFVRRLLSRKKVETNVYALVGKKGYVICSIVPPRAGYVRVNTAEWMARSVDNTMLEIEANIIVVDIKGAHLLVKKL